ncbi:helix-turn-helix domain-containing protein [Scytonema sp. UIC 10036]|nr:helix-turn-helix transcriptional regulator [Scytonema sp. UIC 10036]MUH01883.1 helix-turn-helix domain-containing protein [Scytonema sp. UIC 10036]
MGVGTNLKRLRSKTKFSQQDIADKLNIDRVTYANWESEMSDIKSQYIPKLAEIFEVELKELFENDQKIQVTNNIEKRIKRVQVELVYKKKSYNKHDYHR